MPGPLMSVASMPGPLTSVCEMCSAQHNVNLGQGNHVSPAEPIEQEITNHILLLFIVI